MNSNTWWKNKNNNNRRDDEKEDKEIREAKNHLTSNDFYRTNALQLLSFDFYCIEGGVGGSHSTSWCFVSFLYSSSLRPFFYRVRSVDSKLFGELVKNVAYVSLR